MGEVGCLLHRSGLILAPSVHLATAQLVVRSLPNLGGSMDAFMGDLQSAGTVRDPFLIRLRRRASPLPSLQLVPNPGGARAKLARRSFCCQESSSNNFDGIAGEDVWQRVQLLERLLELSINEEKYVEAKRIRDQLVELKARLTEGEQLLLEKVNSLTKGSIGDRIEVIAALGDLGDSRVLPMLLDGLRDSNPLVASETERAMWKIFMRSGRDNVDRRLQEGVALMLSNELASARDVFTEVIEMAPLFAEGWNKRATINYFIQDYQASIEDCKRVLELNPYHFGALSGMGLCHVAINNLESALSWFEKAYSMHPGLRQIHKYIEELKRNLAESTEEVENKDDENPL